MNDELVEGEMPIRHSDPDNRSHASPERYRRPNGNDWPSPAGSDVLRWAEGWVVRYQRTSQNERIPIPTIAMLQEFVSGYGRRLAR
jgi:hypothetical protein